MVHSKENPTERIMLPPKRAQKKVMKSSISPSKGKVTVKKTVVH
jgi:hypothetical protein